MLDELIRDLHPEWSTMVNSFIMVFQSKKFRCLTFGMDVTLMSISCYCCFFLNKKKKRTPGGFPYCIYEKVFPYLEVSDL